MTARHPSGWHLLFPTKPEEPTEGQRILPANKNRGQLLTVMVADPSDAEDFALTDAPPSPPRARVFRASPASMDGAAGMPRRPHPPSVEACMAGARPHRVPRRAGAGVGDDSTRAGPRPASPYDSAETRGTCASGVRMSWG